MVSTNRDVHSPWLLAPVGRHGTILGGTMRGDSTKPLCTLYCRRGGPSGDLSPISGTLPRLRRFDQRERGPKRPS